MFVCLCTRLAARSELRRLCRDLFLVFPVFLSPVHHVPWISIVLLPSCFPRFPSLFPLSYLDPTFPNKPFRSLLTCESPQQNPLTVRSLQSPTTHIEVFSQHGASSYSPEQIRVALVNRLAFSRVLASILLHFPLSSFFPLDFFPSSSPARC